MRTPAWDGEIEPRLQEMSLEHKLGQVMMIGFDGLTVSPELREMIEAYHVGGVILFARNVESPRQVALLANELQAIALNSGHPGLFIAVDQEGGRVARLTEDKGFSEFPSAMALGAAGDPELAHQVARAMAREMRAVGFNIDFAPDLDVNNNFANPVIGIRSFGSDAAEVARFGTAFMQGLQEEGLLAFGKHFPGHGDTAVDSHIGLPVVLHDRARLEAMEWVPFRALMQAGVAGILAGHLAFPVIETGNPQLPATLSARVLTGLLREEMGFDGLLATDALDMGALAQSGYPAPLAPAMALQAGADLLVFNRDHPVHKKSFELAREWVRTGKISLSRVDEAVRRVLQAKARFGILQPKPADLGKLEAQVGCAEHRALAEAAACRSVTVLRDDAGLVPLPPGRPVLVIEAGMASGLGRLLEVETARLGDPPAEGEVQALVRKTSGKIAVVATTDALSSQGQTELVKSLIKAGIDTVVVAMRRPYDLLAFREAPTYLATYAGNPPALAAAAAVLRGTARAEGRLPVDIPQLYARGSGKM